MLRSLAVKKSSRMFRGKSPHSVLPFHSQHTDTHTPQPCLLALLFGRHLLQSIALRRRRPRHLFSFDRRRPPGQKAAQRQRTLGDDVAQERLLAVSPPLRTLRALGRLSNPLKDEPQCAPPPGIRYVEPSIRADPACAFEWVGGCPGCFDVQLPEGERPALPEVDGKPFKEASARLGTLPPRNVEFTRIKRDGLVAPKVATLQVVKVTSLLPLGGGSERWRGVQCSPEWYIMMA